jgi:predicted phosphodiesterase
MATVVGVISDTHGLLRPEAVEALKGSALILHAGDIGDPAVLIELEEIAPVRDRAAVKNSW